MTINDVTYLSVYGNDLGKKINSDIDSISKLSNSDGGILNFAKRRIFTHKSPSLAYKNVEFIKIPEIDYDKFSEFVILYYPEMFDSEFMLNFHCDGFIANPESWTDIFLRYDYIGAPFDAGGYQRDICSGNGGFSLRSKKFCTELRKLYLRFRNYIKSLDNPNEQEDIISCYLLRKELESRGIKFAPFEVASMFCTEHLAYTDRDFYQSFGIHEVSPASKKTVKQNIVNKNNAKYACRNHRKTTQARRKILKRALKWI
tara:strand:+ start:3088 stop:3861 length:774 start_codon:yes stop_codon:yes gene_type:complete